MQGEFSETKHRSPVWNLAKNHGKAAPLGEAAGVLDGHVGLGPSFHIPLAAGGGLQHKFWYRKMALTVKVEKKIPNCFNASACQVQFWSCVHMLMGKCSRDNK